MILVTGGAGYIGSHTCLQLLQEGNKLVVLDNLSNGNINAIRRVEQLSGKKINFIQGDIRDSKSLDKTFKNPISSVVHFAGLKSVGESVNEPLRYYDNNVNGTLNLLKAMSNHKCHTLVFSSSATVYGNPLSVPISEKSPLSATNPYGQSKLMIEEILRDLASAQPEWRIAILRYFNPVGAHESGMIGEDPKGIPNNLLPFVAQVAIGKREVLNIFGNDYPTHDGTGVRDYIHVMDLASGHLKALQALEKHSGILTANLGTGRGYSVLDIVKAFEEASGHTIPYQIAPRRAGDVATCYADPSQAANLLGWRAEKTLVQMCTDSWRWQVKNPTGYNQEK